MNIQNNIKTLRNNHVLSQQGLADKLTVTRQTISKWERGESDPALPDLVSIAQIFKISLDDLIMGEVKSRVYAYDHENTPAKTIKKENGEAIIPYYTTEDVKGNHAFSKAYKIHQQLRSGISVDVREMRTLYEEALSEGVLEAGANMLHILIKTLLNVRKSQPNGPLPYQEKIQRYITGLEEEGHPAGEYYRAFGLIYGVIQTENTEEEDLDEGIILMYNLANNGNEHAIVYVNYIENSQDE